MVVPKKYQKRFKQWLILTEDSHQWMLSDEELYNDYFKPNLRKLQYGGE
jgi:hypothetical protein